MNAEVKLEELEQFNEWHSGMWKNDGEKPLSISPFSNRCRKRKLDEIENGIREGFYTEKPKCENFNVLVNELGAEIDRLRCRKCRKILSAGPGGHRTNHKNGSCMEKVKRAAKKVEPYEQQNVRNSVVKYFTKSGALFNNVDNAAFRELIRELINIGNREFDTESLNLPSEELIRQEVEKNMKTMVEEISELIHEPVKRNEVCFVIDFGKRIQDLLSIFLVFIDRSETSIRLKAVPLLFVPASISKNFDVISDLIVDAAKRFNLSEDDVNCLQAVGDEVSSIKNIPEPSRFHTLFSRHSIQEMAEEWLNSYEKTGIEYLNEEKDLISLTNEAVDNCASLAAALQRKRKTCKMITLPSAYCQTKFSTIDECCREILSMQSEIDNIEDPFVKHLHEKVKKNSKILEKTLKVIDSFKIPLAVFDGCDPSLHEIVPIMFQIRTNLKNDEENGTKNNDVTLAIISKLVRISLDRFIEAKIDEVHLLAVLLCPGMKSLNTLPDEYKKKTNHLIVERLSSMDSQQEESQTTQRVISSLYETPITMPTSTQELDDYKNMPLCWKDFELSPLEFWEKYANRFPRLAKIASLVFCQLGSQSACEKSYSELSKSFRMGTQKLDPELLEHLMISYSYSNNLF